MKRIICWLFRHEWANLRNRYGHKGFVRYYFYCQRCKDRRHLIDMDIKDLEQFFPARKLVVVSPRGNIIQSIRDKVLWICRRCGSLRWWRGRGE